MCLTCAGGKYYILRAIIGLVKRGLNIDWMVILVVCTLRRILFQRVLVNDSIKEVLYVTLY